MHLRAQQKYTPEIAINDAIDDDSDIFGIHGAGNIGLGLVAPVVMQSNKPYHIVATSNNKFISKIINSTHQLWLMHKSAKNQTHIQNVTIISRNFNDIVKLYKSASIVAICLTPAAFEESIESVAMGLIERYQFSETPLKILVVMNSPDCAARVKSRVNHELNDLLRNDHKVNEINKMVQYIPTVADRIVSKIPEQEVKDQLKKQLLSLMTIDFINEKWLNQYIDSLIENYEELALLLTRLNFKLCLFNAETNFAFYAPKLPIIAEFPAIKRVANVEQIEAVKNKFINGPHAILAWLGALFGCKTIAEAIRVPGMKKFIENLMDDEIAPVLMNAWPGLRLEELMYQKKLFLKRCEDSYDDLVTRVGRDPLRKINAGERIRGTMELARKQTHIMALPGLCYGIAAAILYSVKNCDSSNHECNKIREICHDNVNSITLSQKILLWHGTEGKINFTGFDPKKDSGIIDTIIQCIAMLDEQCKLSENAKEFTFRIKKFQSSTEYLIRHHLNFLPRNVRRIISPRGIAPSRYTPRKDHIMMYSLFRNTSFSREIHEMGITLHPKTGNLYYADTFQPFELNFELILVRHGETFGNCGQSTREGQIDEEMVKNNIKNINNRIFQGNVNTSINQLTQMGKQQALEVAALLEKDYLTEGWIPNAIYHSPLDRAKETGMDFVKQNQLEHIYHPLDGVREMSFGSWENKRICDFNQEDPCHLFYLNQNAMIKDTESDYAECFYDVIKRAYSVLSEMNNTHAESRVLIFSHSMFGAACCILTGHGQKIENGNYLAFDGKRSDGQYYTMPHATPFVLSRSLNFSNRYTQNTI